MSYQFRADYDQGSDAKRRIGINEFWADRAARDEARVEALARMPAQSAGGQVVTAARTKEGLTVADYGASLAAIRAAQFPATIERDGDILTARCDTWGIEMKITVDLTLAEPVTNAAERAGRRGQAMETFLAAARQTVTALAAVLDERGLAA